MGHIRLGNLPKTRHWQEVVSLVSSSADLQEIAAATASAAERGLSGSADDAGLVESLWLLTQLPLAARADDYVDRLRNCGLDVHEEPTLVELCAAFSAAVDARVDKSASRTDLGEMAGLSAIETIAKTIGDRVPVLFGTTPQDVRAALSGLATSAQFAAFGRGFFSRLMERYLAYFLSKELSNHVGVSQRFVNTEARSAFDDALRTHCREASRIVGTFAGGWFSKTNFEGGITREKAGRFAYVALKKITAELRKRRDANEN